MKNNEYYQSFPHIQSLRANHDITTDYTMPKLHRHDIYEIYLSNTDNIEYFVNNHIYKVNINDIFVFNPSDIHRTSIQKNVLYDRYILLFHPDFIKNYSTEKTDLLSVFKQRKPFNHKRHLTEEQKNVFLNYFDKLTKEDDGQYGFDVIKKTTLANLLVFVNAIYANRTPNTSIPIFESDPKLKPVIEYIENNLANDLSLDILAKVGLMSKFYLSRKFKDTTGFSVHDYVINQRLILARELLKTETNVSKVCELSGFGNISHFVTTFKKHTGISPKQYALRIKNISL